MTSMQPCRHRGAVTDSTCECGSNRLLHAGTVPLHFCASQCPYANRDLLQAESPGLGDRIEQALTAVGITKERVEAFVGAPCGCTERKEKLNRLGAWAASVIAGWRTGAKIELEDMLDEDGRQ